MRMPKQDEDLTGKICINSVGRVGVVTGKYTPDWGGGAEMWCGLGIDGRGTWASYTPCVVGESAEEYRQMLSDRFGGRLSFHA